MARKPTSYHLKLARLGDKYEPILKKEMIATLKAAKDKISVETIKKYLTNDNNQKLFDYMTENVNYLEGNTTILTLSEASIALHLNQAERSISVDQMRPRLLKSIEKNALKKAKGFSDVEIARIKELLTYNVKNNLHVSELSKMIRETIGLNDRQESFWLKTRDKIMADENIMAGAKEKLISKSYDNLISQRADLISRTESFTVINNSKLDLFNELKESGAVEENQTVSWDSVMDSGTCEECEKLDGTIIKIGESFDTDEGPLDGPPLHCACRCLLTLN